MSEGRIVEEVDLSALLQDLGRHLRWQSDSSGNELLGARTQSAASARLPDPVRAPAPRSDSVRAPAPPVSVRSAAPLSDSVPAPVPPPDLVRDPGPPSDSAQVAASPPDTGAFPPPPLERPRRALDEIRSALGDCRRCKLCTGRKQVVFGSGHPRARLVFVGEGPGAEEDAQGVPFVGAAGQLLTKMIQAMGLQRDQVYICNVVKCRPPGNRNPEPDEIASCQPFLEAQLESIRPEVIVTLGKFAAQTLLRTQTPITRLRGQWRSYLGIRVMPTFHPAYLLRNPAEKKAAWSDLQHVMTSLQGGTAHA